MVGGNRYVLDGKKVADGCPKRRRELWSPFSGNVHRKTNTLNPAGKESRRTIGGGGSVSPLASGLSCR